MATQCCAGKKKAQKIHLGDWVLKGAFGFVILIGGWLMSYQSGIILSLFFCAVVCSFMFAFGISGNKPLMSTFIIFVFGVIFFLMSAYVPEGKLIYRDGSVEYAEAGFYLPFEHEKPATLRRTMSGWLTIKNKLPSGLSVSIYYEPPMERLTSKEWERIVELVFEGVEIPIYLFEVSKKNTKENIRNWMQNRYPHKLIKVEVD